MTNQKKANSGIYLFNLWVMAPFEKVIYQEILEKGT